jgi:hypothetical protein
MKPIERGELYEHVCGFLKGKGIELSEGSYAKGIQNGCSILADAINLSQKGLSKAKVGFDKKLDQMRQVIHEKTAPRPSPQPEPPKAAAEPPKAPPRRRTTKGAKRATTKRPTPGAV